MSHLEASNSEASNSEASNLEATDPTTANYDAQQLVEQIAADSEAAPKVDVDADYERSKQFDMATEQAVSAESVATSTGNPEDFLAMAKQVTPDLDAPDA